MDPSRRFVRQFAMVKGRAHAQGGNLPLDSLITAVPDVVIDVDMPPEQVDLLERCASPLSIAEISAGLGVHLGIARVLVGDLVEAGLVTIREGFVDAAGPDLLMLKKVYDDLRNF